MSKKRDHEDKTRELFREATQDARPLRQDRVAPYRKRRRPIPKQTLRDQREVMDRLLSDPYVSPDIETGEELLFARPGVQHNVMRKFRRGQYAVEAELDLHRLTATEAREQLAAFLRTAGAQGRRCVQVIHGKGLGSAGGLPVLKTKVNHWLRQWDEVLAFCSAQPKDGGTGAVYVLLKRK